MSRLLCAAAAITALAAARPAAADGFYFLEGLGVTSYGDELGQFVDDNGLNVRAAIGHRSGQIAVEAWLRAEISFASGYAGREGTTSPFNMGDGVYGAYGLDLKVLQPLSRHWSAYARAGASRMVLDTAGYAGRGLGATAGIQVSGKVPALGLLWWPLFFLAKDYGPKVHTGLWLEASHSFYRLHGPGPSIDARFSGWTLGFSIGQDF